MKRVFLSLLITPLLFASCKKNSDRQTDNNYYVKYKLNGVPVTNTGANVVSIHPNNGIAGMIDFQLASTTSDFKNTLGIAIQRIGGVNTGTYNSNDNSYIVTVDYFEDQASANERDYSTDNASGMPASSFTVTITAITNDYAKGNFTSNYLHDYIHNESLVISEGEFYVRLSH